MVAAMGSGHHFLGRPHRAQEARQRLAGHVLHHHEELALGGHDVERRDHVGVADARREPRLVEEHGDELGVLRQGRVQSLDGDRPREPDGAQQAADVNGRHPAGGDLGVQRVASYGAGGGVRRSPVALGGIRACGSRPSTEHPGGPLPGAL